MCYVIFCACDINTNCSKASGGSGWRASRARLGARTNYTVREGCSSRKGCSPINGTPRDWPRDCTTHAMLQNRAELLARPERLEEQTATSLGAPGNRLPPSPVKPAAALSWVWQLLSTCHRPKVSQGCPEGYPMCSLFPRHPSIPASHMLHLWRSSSLS